MGWSPRTFWRTTLTEFFDGIEGFNRAHRSGREPMTRAEFEALEAQYLRG